MEEMNMTPENQGTDQTKTENNLSTSINAIKDKDKEGKGLHKTETLQDSSLAFQ